MDEKEQLYNLLKEVFLILDSGDRQLFSHHDLSLPRYYTLYHLADSPGLPLKEISERLFCDKSNVTRIFRGLETKGLVRRSSHESDGRSFRAYLTDEGTAVLRQVSQAHQQFNQDRLGSLNKKQRKNLLESLTILKEQLYAINFQTRE